MAIWGQDHYGLAHCQTSAKNIICYRVLYLYFSTPAYEVGFAFHGILYFIILKIPHTGDLFQIKVKAMVDQKHEEMLTSKKDSQVAPMILESL